MACSDLNAHKPKRKYFKMKQTRTHRPHNVVITPGTQCITMRTQQSVNYLHLIPELHLNNGFAKR